MVSITFIVRLVLDMEGFMILGGMVLALEDLEGSVELDLDLEVLDSVMVAWASVVMVTEDLDLDLTILDLEDFTLLTDTVDSLIGTEDLALEDKVLPLIADDVVFITIEILLPQHVPQDRVLRVQRDDLT